MTAAAGAGGAAGAGRVLASSCIGCPTSGGHGAVIAIALVVNLAGAVAWVYLSRVGAVLGRAVGSLLILIGLVLLVVQA